LRLVVDDARVPIENRIQIDLCDLVERPLHQVVLLGIEWLEQV
jgi:hypothetical protein